MARALALIEQEVRGLSSSDQESLLRTLLEELDGPPDAGIAWREEVERRSREIDFGAVQCIPAEQVFEEIGALQKK
jgi:putative addiction module component (TIGR02574 family)